MADILIFQPQYANYRRELFDFLHENYNVTFVFIRGPGSTEYEYSSGIQSNPNWDSLTLFGEKDRFWPLKLFRQILKLRPNVIVTSINGSLQTFVAIVAGRVRNISVVLWSENWGATYRSLGSPRWKRLLRKFRTGLMTRCVDAVVVGGNRAKRFHRSIGVDEQDIFLAFQSTIDHRLFEKETLGERVIETEPGTISFLYFSRIVVSKGLDVLVKAFANIESQYPTARLMVVGDGPFRMECQALTTELGVENARFYGSVANEEAWRYFREADVFVLPCSGKGRGEGWGLVLNEAASMSLPIVTTEAVGAVGDLVIDGVNGFVVTPGDVDEMTSALRELLVNVERRKAMGMESRSLFETINSYERMYDGFAAAIDSVLLRKKYRR